MPDFTLLTQLFAVGTALNLIWEVSHCWLYTTCRQQTWRQNVPLLVSMAIKDGFFITLLYSVASTVTGNSANPVDPITLTLFAVVALTFSFVDEKVSLRLGRWQYTASMPLIFGVGLTPLLEIALTGLIAVWLVAALG